MANGRDRLSHFFVAGRVANEVFNRRGRGDSKVRPVEDRVGHGRGRLSELESALDSSDVARRELLTEEELRALGTIVTLEGGDPAYPLKVGPLQRFTRRDRKNIRRPKWLLLSVLPAEPEGGLPERATVWVADQYRHEFIRLFQDYLEDGTTGKPKNNGLIANIGRIRSTFLRDLWQSSGEPTAGVSAWWEVWLHPSDNGPQLLRGFADALSLRISSHVLRLIDRDVMWLEARWDQLDVLPISAVPVAEIRRPYFIDTFEDLTVGEQAEYSDNLAQRLEPAEPDQPAVCHLDTGVARTHILLEESLAPDDLQTVVGASGFDVVGHGTAMAGIALFGQDLDRYLIGSDPVILRHRLESVRIKPTRSEPQHNPLAFGDVTAQAVALADATSMRRRVFCLPITATGDLPSAPGQPTLWSATIDALAAGADVVRDGDELQLLAPDFQPAHPLLSIRTAGHINDQALSSANATSAATAQAARLAALSMVTYPEYWPETVRALLVHAAHWTPAMRQALDVARRKGLKQQQAMLRRYGWGVPTEDRVLYSSDQAATVVVQDEFVPFEGGKFKSPVFRMHELPWPTEVLESLGGTRVDLRITLSYFVQPTASRRGWRQRYKYPSHSLRFELQDPLESDEHFVQRVNQAAGADDSGARAPSKVDWLVGPNQRNLGSLHQDVWETSALEISQAGKLAVYPVGGWWKYGKARDRVDRAVRYALVVSLKTAENGIDLYTPIANMLRIPIPIE